MVIIITFVILAYIVQFDKNYTELTVFKFRLEQFTRNYNLIN